MVGPRPVLLYCVIAVLLNGIFALGWKLWREVEFSQKQTEQINEMQIQLRARSDREPLSSSRE